MSKKMVLSLIAIVVAVLLGSYVGLSIHHEKQAQEEQARQEALAEQARAEAAAQKEAQEAEAARHKSITISAVGDCALGKLIEHGYEGSLLDYYDTYGADYFFQNVEPVFAADDLTLANLECVLTNETAAVEKTFNIKGYPQMAEILPAASIEVVSLANNHSTDYGVASREETMAAVESVGVKYAYRDTTVLYETEEGIKVGIIGVNFLEDAATQEGYVTEGIADLKARGANLIVVFCHWGIEHTHDANANQVEWAHFIVDAGADLVIGCHPHVLQGVETYKDKVILYSLGNFCFGANHNPQPQETLIYQQTFTFTDGVLDEGLDASIIPCALSSSSNTNDYCPKLAEGDYKAQIISNMNTYSAVVGTTSFDAEGKLIFE